MRRVYNHELLQPEPPKRNNHTTTKIVLAGALIAPLVVGVVAAASLSWLLAVLMLFPAAPLSFIMLHALFTER
jgi:integral membrane sensor domain MASE1